MKHIWKGKNIKITLLIFLCITGMFLCLVKKDEFKNEGSVRYDSASISPQNLEQALGNERQESTEQGAEVKYLLWSLIEKRQIKTLPTGKTKTLNIVECNGEALLFSHLPLISGSILQRKDEIGCLIDMKTAYDLFGTVQAVGNLIVWENKEYIVRGVIKTSEEFIMIEDSDLQKMYFNMELQLKQKGSTSSLIHTIKDLLFSASIQSDGLVINNQFFITIERFFYLLPSMLLCIFFIYRKLPYSSFICFILCLTVIFVFLLLFQIPIAIPDEFIPNQWSDFDFYQIKYKEIMSEINKFNHSFPMYKEIYLKKNLNLSIAYSVISVIFIFGSNVCGIDNKCRKI